jgi:hypothetical protein
MRWGVRVGMVVRRAACPAAALTLTPALETAQCSLVYTRGGPRAPGQPQATNTPADRSTLQEVRKYAPTAWSPRD